VAKAGNIKQIKRQVEAQLPTSHGDFRMIAYAEDDGTYSPHLAVVSKAFDPAQPVLVRVHSECLTGDTFGSSRCDCGDQLHEALRQISKANGVLIYLRQEGRGIGLINKLQAYNLQDKGYNTKEANIHLGFEADERTYEMAISILKDLEIEKIRLLTNNPDKIDSIENSSIELVERVPLVIKAGDENRSYLETKRDFMGHLLEGL
jgi:3,4-dihydroxy 2-butanone 4-phosphate synthase/GTP cyclohydrolase II